MITVMQWLREKGNKAKKYNLFDEKGNQLTYGS